MTDLVEFLRARLDEDEQVARLAISGQVDWEEGWGAERPKGRQATITPHVGVIHEAVQAAHVVRWNPARVLTDVDAKRRLLALHPHYPYPSKPGGVWCDCMAEDGVIESDGRYCDTVRLLALPYADHPDYRAEWRAGEDTQ